MKINLKKQMKCVVAVSLIGIVTACSMNHKNPLSRINEEDSAQFLVDASHYSEIKIKRNLGDKGYEKCMDEKLDKKTCDKIYGHMLDYAKTQPLFKTLTQGDLTDFDVWQKLKEDYAAKAYAMLPLPESAYQ